MNNTEFNIDVLRELISDALERIDSVIGEDYIEKAVIENKQYIVEQLNKIRDWHELLFILCEDEDEEPIDTKTRIRIRFIETYLSAVYPNEFTFKTWNEVKK